MSGKIKELMKDYQTVSSVVRQNGVTSNQLFNILEDWNHILQGVSVDLIS